MGGSAALRRCAEAKVALTVDADKKTEAVKISLDVRPIGLRRMKVVGTT
jgi:hypothetical protein